MERRAVHPCSNLLASALRGRKLLVLRLKVVEKTRQVGPRLRGRIRRRLELPCQPGLRFPGLGQRGVAGGFSAGEAVVQLVILPAQPGEVLIDARRVPTRGIDGFGELGNVCLCEFARTFQFDPTGVRLRQFDGQAFLIALERLSLVAQFRVCRLGFDEVLEHGPSLIQSPAKGVRWRLPVFLCALFRYRRFTSHEHEPRRPAGYIQVGCGRRSVEQKSAEGNRDQQSDERQQEAAQ